MLTNLSKEQLVLLGRNVSARLMIDQARYTLGQVSMDPSVKSRLGAAFLAETRAVVDALESALRDRHGAHASAVTATASQKLLVKEALRYRVALVREMSQARRRGVEVPVQATIGGATENPTALANELERILAMAFPAANPLAELGVTKVFLQEGKKFVTRLRDSEEQQELAKRARQKAAVARKRELSGLVLSAVRTMNDVAKSVHRGDPVAASEYNFAVKRGVVRAPSEAPPPADSPPATGAA